MSLYECTITTVLHVEPIQKCFHGPRCDQCGDWTTLLSTTNEWRYYCRPCDRRTNDVGEVMDTTQPHWERDRP